MTTPKYGSWSSAPNGMVTQVIPQDTRGPKRLWNAGKGYVTRHRGAPVARATYVCPVHGAFEARAGTDSVACPTTSRCSLEQLQWFDAMPDGAGAIVRQEVRVVCGLTSPWSPSTFAAWASSGEVKS